MPGGLTGGLAWVLITFHFATQVTDIDRNCQNLILIRAKLVGVRTRTGVPAFGGRILSGASPSFAVSKEWGGRADGSIPTLIRVFRCSELFGVM